MKRKKPERNAMRETAKIYISPRGINNLGDML